MGKNVSSGQLFCFCWDRKHSDPVCALPSFYIYPLLIWTSDMCFSASMCKINVNNTQIKILTVLLFWNHVPVRLHLEAVFVCDFQIYPKRHKNELDHYSGLFLSQLHVYG